MAAALRFAVGDPNYLKVVLLEGVLNIPQHLYSKSEGGVLQLSLPDGKCVTSANEICKHLCNLAGKVSFCLDEAQNDTVVDQWLIWEATKLQPSVAAFVRSGSPSEDLHACLKKVDEQLSVDTTECLLQGSKTLSLVDISVWATLYVMLAPESKTGSGALLSKYANVGKWFNSLSNKSSFCSAVEKGSGGIGYEAYHHFCVVEDKHACEQPPALSAELEAARVAWFAEKAHIPSPVKREHPILPLQGERNILITSALPYVNNVPHLGNIIGCVLSADVFARYCRLRNYNTLYICGTDEYGTATETKALEEGLTPQEICEKYFVVHSEIYKWFGISFDYFGRTSTPQQTEIAQDIFWKLYERGYIMKDTVDQLHCSKCNMFLADRFVEGICPLCAYPDARGDQCDKCGKLINATELKSPRCKMCASSPQIVTSNHLFLDLCKLEVTVKDWSKKSSSEGMWSNNAQQITTSWLRDGLKPRCITRDLKWGTPVPLEGYESKVFYVWFDAPIGYLSITAGYTEQWEKWWKNPQQVENYQFMAKDNVPFHTVVFPCSLLGTGDNYTLLNNISSTEYLNYENGKFSKSRGVGVFGNDAQETGIPADVYRFYLLYVRPETQDSIFSWSDFVFKHNTELLNNLGNFINRVLTFTANNFDSTLQEMCLSAEDTEFIVKVTNELKSYLDCLEKVRLRDGLKHVLSISRLGNAYLQAHKPWILVKQGTDDCARAGSVLGVCTNSVCLLSVMMQPYMPDISQRVQEQLQAPPECNVLIDEFVPFLKPGHKIGKPAPLFSKIDESTVAKLKGRFSGKQTT